MCKSSRLFKQRMHISGYLQSLNSFIERKKTALRFVINLRAPNVFHTSHTYTRIHTEKYSKELFRAAHAFAYVPTSASNMKSLFMVLRIGFSFT